MRARLLLLALLMATSPVSAQPRQWPTEPPRVEKRGASKSAWQRFIELLFHLFGGDRPQWRGPFGDDCLEPACRGLPRDRGPQPSRD